MDYGTLEPRGGHWPSGTGRPTQPRPPWDALLPKHETTARAGRTLPKDSFFINIFFFHYLISKQACLMIGLLDDYLKALFFVNKKISLENEFHFFFHLVTAPSLNYSIKTDSYFKFCKKKYLL